MSEKVLVRCPPCACGKVLELELDAAKVRRWRGGEFVQDVFPELSDDEREALVSGCCPECWEMMFGEDASGESGPCAECGKYTDCQPVGHDDEWICFMCYMTDNHNDVPWPGEDDPDPVDPTQEGWRP